MCFLLVPNLNLGGTQTAAPVQHALVKKKKRHQVWRPPIAPTIFLVLHKVNLQGVPPIEALSRPYRFCAADG